MRGEPQRQHQARTDPCLSTRDGKASLPATLPGLLGSSDAALESTDGLRVPGASGPRLWRSQREASRAGVHGEPGQLKALSSPRLLLKPTQVRCWAVRCRRAHARLPKLGLL